jgi:arsenate reductase
MSAKEPKRRILFLCTHNSARSQMAEGLLRHVGGELFDVHSAGTEATFVRPLAVRVMGEIGIDISHQQSKTLERFLGDEWDAVVTVCDAARETCPYFPRARVRLHWSLPDPSQAEGDEAAQLTVYRSVRDALVSHVERDLLAGAGLRGDTAGTGEGHKTR